MSEEEFAVAEAVATMPRRANVLGLGADDLAFLLETDPEALFRSLDDLLSQAEPVADDPVTRDIASMAAMIAATPPGAFRTGISPARLAAHAAQSEQWLTWLERFLKPYHPSGNVMQRRTYAPCLDIRCAAPVARLIESEAIYATSSTTSGSVTFSSPGLGFSGSFTQSVTATLTFGATKGTHQLTLPVDLEITEWRHAYTGDLRYTAKVTGVFAPIQVDEFEPRYTQVSLGKWTNQPIGSNVAPLTFNQMLSSGMSLEATLPLGLGTGRTLNLDYKASSQTDLELTVRSSAKKIFTLETGVGSPLALRFS